MRYRRFKTPGNDDSGSARLSHLVALSSPAPPLGPGASAASGATRVM